MGVANLGFRPIGDIQRFLFAGELQTFETYSVEYKEHNRTVVLYEIYLVRSFSRLIENCSKETARMISDESFWTNISSSIPRNSRFFRSRK